MKIIRKEKMENSGKSSDFYLPLPPETSRAVHKLHQPSRDATVVKLRCGQETYLLTSKNISV